MFSTRIPSRLLPYVVTIVRAGTTTDRYGNTVPDWTTATRKTTAAWLEQNVAAEDDDDRAQLTSRWLLVVPANVDVKGNDRVEHDGNTFEVIGPPSVARTPSGAHHIEAQLEWVQG